jgi:predicted AAA+ superfamily ATPase
MRDIPLEQIAVRMQAENPWWREPHEVGKPYSGWKQRAYLDLFLPLVLQKQIHRALILMGPRRVGKTVLIHHTIQQLIRRGVHPRQIWYFSVDHPLYTGCGLEQLLNIGLTAHAQELPTPDYVFFDEIQYLKNWEIHLKALVDNHPNIKFIASGSAAAALRLKSSESGAGRFSDFLLPPLTFYEYLDLLDLEALAQPFLDDLRSDSSLGLLNEQFVKYLNVGGYPEVALSELIQANPSQFIKADIIDKVLLRDLPSLYGIGDIQELHQLFTTLAFNTAGEVSLDQLSQRSGVVKSTLKRYIEYLEAAFLIKVVHRIDRNARHFQKANFFKVYLTNPSMRSALFAPLTTDDPLMGSLVETGVFSQYFHANTSVYYARWHQGRWKGEVDIVRLSPGRLKPDWVVEVKWSDSVSTSDLKNLIGFCQANDLKRGWITSRSQSKVEESGAIQLIFMPASVLSLRVGHGIIMKLKGTSPVG